MIFRLVLFAVGVSLVCVILRENYRSGAVLMTIAGSISLMAAFVWIFAQIKTELSVFTEGVNSEAVSVIGKTLAVAYLTSFGCDICMDAGEKAVAGTLETAGKTIMLSMALPMILTIFKSVKELIGV